MAKKKKTTSAKKSKPFATAEKTAQKATKAAFNFADTSSYMNPQQFFNSFSKAQSSFKPASFQAPANVQQWIEQCMETSQKNMETFTACAQLAAERTKELLEEQTTFVSKLIQETTTTVQDTIASSSDPKAKLTDMADYTQYVYEKASSAARKATEENMQIAQKITDKLSKRATEAADELRSAA